MYSEIFDTLFFDNAPDAVFLHSPSGKFLAVNKTACERLGYSHAQLMQMTPADIDSEEDRFCFPQRIAMLKNNGIALFEATHISRTGHRIPVELHCRMVHYRGQPAILSIARDIHKRRELESRVSFQMQLQRCIADISAKLVLAKGTDFSSTLLSLGVSLRVSFVARIR